MIGRAFLLLFALGLAVHMQAGIHAQSTQVQHIALNEEPR
ncbi:MAG: hypothetical protein JWP29_1971 [Rhodoferax sp.]|nr:hypothetical protein [Rhodoferax sp.]